MSARLTCELVARANLGKPVKRERAEKVPLLIRGHMNNDHCRYRQSV